MLRNYWANSARVAWASVLNEVLSLNAQESGVVTGIKAGSSVLNEVLSLNAQESQTAYRSRLRFLVPQ